MVMNQISQQGREQIRSALEALGRERATAWLTLDGRGEGWATLRLTRFASQPARRETLGTAHPHGRWLAWGSEGAL
jgi:hypothetical protein